MPRQFDRGPQGHTPFRAAETTILVVVKTPTSPTTARERDLTRLLAHGLKFELYCCYAIHPSVNQIH
jgi:hypothetical protein